MSEENEDFRNLSNVSTNEDSVNTKLIIYDESESIEKQNIDITKNDTTMKGSMLGKPGPDENSQDFYTSGNFRDSAKAKGKEVLVDVGLETEMEMTRPEEQNTLEKGENRNLELLEAVSRRHSILTSSDSDSENEDISNTSVDTNIKKFKPLSRKRTVKRLIIVDTDSDPEDITPHDKSFSSDVALNTNMMAKTLPILDSGSETEPNNSQKVINETDKTFESDKIIEKITLTNTDVSFEDLPPSISVNPYDDNSKFTSDPTTCEPSLKSKSIPDKTTTQKSRLALLCDSDSDEEPNSSYSNSMLSDDKILEQSKYANRKKAKVPRLSKETAKTKTKNTSTEVTQKMTYKQVTELRKEIQSESQRMMREKDISLPYHKPKAHSLKEFLARRPRLATTVSAVSAPPSVAIKMTIQQLEVISQKLKEREKEVKEFYKSESESENDDLDLVPPANEANTEAIAEENPTSDVENINVILETTKTTVQENETELTEEVIKEYDYTQVREVDVNTLQITEVANKQKIQEKENYTQCMEPNNDANNMQGTDQMNNEIDESRSIAGPEIEQEETTGKATSEEEPIKITSISQTDDDKISSGNHEEIVESFQSANNDNSAQTSANSDFHLSDKITKSNNSADSSGDNQPSSNLNENLKRFEPESGLESSPPQQEPMTSREFSYSDFDMEIENFTNSENQHDITEESHVDKPVSIPFKSKLDILKEKLANIKPKLSGGPDTIINLSSAVIKPKEVVELMERFTKHVTSKNQHSKHKVQISVVTVESGGDICKETVSVNVDNDEVEVLEEKPGAKLQKLREELQKQMDKKKSDIWQQKASKGIWGSEETCEDDEYSEKGEDDNFCSDEEAEMTEEEDSEEWEDVELSDKPQKKSCFLDQEAEESAEEETLHNDEYEKSVSNEEEEITESIDKAPEDLEEDFNDLINVNEGTASEVSDLKPGCNVEEKKTLKRIIRIDDDSDEDDLFSDSIDQKAVTDNEHLDSTITADEDDIPPHQTRQLQTPMRQAVSQTKSISDFLTPISFIASIQNLASASKTNKSGPVVSPFRMTQAPTIDERLAVSQKQLFTDSQQSQEFADIQIAQQCSSGFEPEDDSATGYTQSIQMENNDEPSTQDLVGICSGEFTGITHLDSSHGTKKHGDFDGSQTSELDNLGTDQEMVISQLLDEEELENFKKKFESPVKPVSNIDNVQEITGGRVIDTDDEDEENCGPRKKKNQQRIQFSDDESLDEETSDREEEIDLQDNDEEIDNLGYDSEENEIDLNKIEKREKVKLTDFLDAEAELSESDWGSEDEDEKDMDKLEFELGDTDKFDEEKVREDLGKIHLRRMLDQDTREVKLLQEVLLEDGEMHGTGRQRQFKWKNIELSDDQPEEQKDDEIYLDEENSEEHWRKQRHEREMYLKEKQHKSQDLEFTDNDLLNESQLLKIGQKVLHRSSSQNNSQTNTPIEKSNNISGSPVIKKTFSIFNKRGSFLSRSDQALQRVAEYTKVTVEDTLNSTKTTKNVLFQSASALEVKFDVKKRKASDGTPKVLKRLRLNTNPYSLALIKKAERSKKLFNF